MSDQFPGLSYRGVEPDPRLDGWVADGVQLWREFEQTLPPAQQGLLFSSDNPRLDGSQTQRGNAVTTLADSINDLAVTLMDRVLDDEDDYTILRWRADLTARAQAAQAVAAMVEHGGDLYSDEASRRRISEACQNLETRLAALALRAGLDPDDPESITGPQCRAWGGASARGLVRAAGQMGVAARLDDGLPIRRIMTAFESHCPTCPGKALTYDSLEDCITACGGWPGDGSDACHGNCLCSLESTADYSVFGEDRAAILELGDRADVGTVPPGSTPPAP